MIHLRPHHALCLQTYVGKGYSDAFAKNMTQISEKLAQRPAQLVHFNLGADEICQACPHLQNGVCSKEASCAELDRLAWDAMALGCGEVLTWAEATQLVEQNLLRTGKFHQLCDGCTWEELCTARRQSLTNTPK